MPLLQQHIQLSAETLTFPDTGEGYESPAQAIVISNIGWDEITIFDTVLTGDYILKSAVPSSLLAGEHATVQVAFMPTKLGVRPGSIYFDTGNAAGDELVNLTGTGTVATPLDMTDDELAFFVREEIEAYADSRYISQSALQTVIDTLQAASGGAVIEEAPVDGTGYVRKDAAWAAETGGSGGGGSGSGGGDYLTLESFGVVADDPTAATANVAAINTALQAHVTQKKPLKGRAGAVYYIDEDLSLESDYINIGCDTGEFTLLRTYGGTAVEGPPDNSSQAFKAGLWANSVGTSELAHLQILRYDVDPNYMNTLTYEGYISTYWVDDDTTNAQFQDAYHFRVSFTDTAETFLIIIDKDFGNQAAATTVAETVAARAAVLPKVMREHYREIYIVYEGSSAFGGTGLAHIERERYELRLSQDKLEETLFHEGVHATLQETSSGKGLPYLQSAEWDQAVLRDNAHITDYCSASEQEDFAESALFAYGVIFHPERFTTEEYDAIVNQIPNRIEFFRTVFGADDDTSSDIEGGVVLGLYGPNGSDPVATLALGNNLQIGRNKLVVPSTANMQVGDIIRLVSNKAWYNDPRGANGFSDSDAYGTVVAATASTLTLNAAFDPDSPVVGESVTIVDGTGRGQAREVTAYNIATKVITVSPNWAITPNTTSKYRFPQATKGETKRITRIVNGTTIEVEGGFYDGYHVVDHGTEGVAKEKVSIKVYRPFTPVVKGLKIDTDIEGAADNFCMLVGPGSYRAKIALAVKNSRRSGCTISGGYAGDLDIVAEGINDASTGYGSQISHCAEMSVTGRGWGNRRLFDISGTTPCDRTRVHDVQVHGGGLREDGEMWSPFGAPDSNGLGSHGPGRDTIYEDCHIDGVHTGIYERGRGSKIRRVTFGPLVKRPINLVFGGTHEIYENRVDPGVFEQFTANNDWVEESRFGDNSNVAFADCMVRLEANLLAGQPDSHIIIRDNVAKVKSHLVECNSTSGSTVVLDNLDVFDNTVEYFPDSTASEAALIGTSSDHSGGFISIKGQRIGPNKQRTAPGNAQPLNFGSNVILTSEYGAVVQHGEGYYTVRIENQSVAVIPVPLVGRNKLRVAIVLDGSTGTMFEGWLTKNDTGVIAIMTSASTEHLAVAPTGANGTNGRLQTYFGDGKLIIGNRLGGAHDVSVWIAGIC